MNIRLHIGVLAILLLCKMANTNPLDDKFFNEGIEILAKVAQDLKVLRKKCLQSLVDIELRSCPELAQIFRNLDDKELTDEFLSEIVHKAIYDDFLGRRKKIKIIRYVCQIANSISFVIFSSMSQKQLNYFNQKNALLVDYYDLKADLSWGYIVFKAIETPLSVGHHLTPAVSLLWGLWGLTSENSRDAFTNFFLCFKDSNQKGITISIGVITAIIILRIIHKYHTLPKQHLEKRRQIEEELKKHFSPDEIDQIKRIDF